MSHPAETSRTGSDSVASAPVGWREWASSRGAALGFDRAVSAESLALFRIAVGLHEGVRLTLAGIAELPSTRVVVPDDQFAARFTGASGVDLFPDTYEFDTDSFGNLPLYVSPLVDVGGVVTGYEALVNRFVPPGVVPPPTTGKGDRP